MPSAFAHAAPVIALAPVFWTPTAPRMLWLVGVLAAMAPDLDVLAFRVGIPYEHPLGHRGLWHSIPFAAAVAGVLTFGLFRNQMPGFSRARAFLFLFLATASHGILDAFTNGGLGVALLSPFDDTRYFAPLRPIEVSPLTPQKFFTARGLTIVASELRWVWLPFLSLAAVLLAYRRQRSSSATARLR
jgi:inner membrane protein